MADLAHLWPPFREQVERLLADPEARRLGIYVVSAFRSDALQAQLFADAVKRYGSEAAARKWVAPPGKSNHGPRVNDDGHKPGPWGTAVDLGVVGFAAVEGRWPVDLRRKVDALAARYHLASPMEWEDWHYEPIPGALAPAKPVTVTIREAPVAMVVIDPKATPDKSGRIPNWQVDEDGNLYAWNGARPLKALSAFTTSHPKIVAVVIDPTGDGVVMFGADTRQEGDGSWVRSTYKILVGM